MKKPEGLISHETVLLINWKVIDFTNVHDEVNIFSCDISNTACGNTFQENAKKCK
jgi:hypothetical protein